MARGWEKTYSGADAALEATDGSQPRAKASTKIGRDMPRVSAAASAIFKKQAEAAAMESAAAASSPLNQQPKARARAGLRNAESKAARVEQAKAALREEAASPAPVSDREEHRRRATTRREPGSSGAGLTVPTDDAQDPASSGRRAAVDSVASTPERAASSGAASSGAEPSRAGPTAPFSAVDAAAEEERARALPTKSQAAVDEDERPRAGPTQSYAAVDDMAPPERSGSRTRAAWIEAALRGRRRQAAGLALVPGQVIQGTRYRLLRWIGDGGMGVVYEAEHVDLERRVALKILRHEACHEPAAIQAFRDEARAVGRIGAEQIVDVFDFAELPDGRLMFAMELIEGTPLYRLYEEQLLSMGRVFAILRQLCKGLAAAHAAGIIHRDIKPDNIIVGTRRGRADAVKILDFGIATILAEQHNAESGLAGTPYYLAPEIVSGLTFDARVDIYALGCTAYEMLVGEPPFFHEALDKSLKAHLVEQPRRPSIVTGRDVPRELEEVVLRCLEKIPGDRYPDMASLEAALCRAQLKARIISEWDDLPLPEVDPDERAELLSGYAELAAVRGPTRRSRALLWGVIAGVFGLAIALWFFAAPAADSEELAALEQLADKARTAASRASFVYPLSSDPSAPTAYAIIDDIEALRSSVGRVASRRADALREEFAGTLVGLGDEYWERPGGKGFAVDYYAQALLFEPDNAAANNRVTYTPGQLAVLRDKVERHDFTERDFFIAATLEALAEQNPEVRARKIEALQRDEEQAVSTQETLEELLRGDPAIVRPTKIAQRPKPIKEETQPTKDPTEDPTEDGPPTPPDLPTEEPVSVTDPIISDAPSADALVRDAKAAMNGGRDKDAERLYEKALAADSRSAPALIGLSDVHFNRGDYDKAANYARRAVKLRPKNAAYRMKLGDAYYKVFRYEEAREHYAAAMAQGHPDAERLLKKVESKLGK